MLVHRELIVEAITELLRNAVEADSDGESTPTVTIAHHDENGNLVPITLFNPFSASSDGTRQPLPWLKSTSGERVPAKRPPEPLTLLERILVLMVVVAVGCFEVWFFFFAGSSLPNQ